MMQPVNNILQLSALKTETGLVNSEILSIPVCSEAATGQNIFNLMDKDLTDRNVTWEKCLSMGSDNASVQFKRILFVTK